MQQEEASRFGFESTAVQVAEGIDLAGRTALVTGGSGGLGAESARVLASRGARVLIGARDVAKAEGVAAGIRKSTGNDAVEVGQLELGSLPSIRAFAEATLARHRAIHILLNNAGVMACPLDRTEQGSELQFGTNHLGHFVLVNRIAGLLKPGGRLVNLSSSGHRFSDVDLEDPNFERTPYTEFGAYGRSKTANILFAVEFDRRYKDKGIRAAAVHPGGIQTELGRHMSPEAIAALRERMTATRPAGEPEFQWKTIPQGAATSLWAAIVAPADEVGGKYCEDCHVAKPVENPEARTGVRSYALNPDTARALWSLSERMVGETF